MRILNFGSLNLDHVYTVEHFVTPGETISASRFQHFLGGKGHNQSIALAKAGACVFHAGRIGADGEVLRHNLQAYGVQTDFITLSESASGHALIQVNSLGQNAIIVYPGANGDIDEDFINEVLLQFTSEDALLMQNEISNPAVLIKKAKERGLKLILNPSPITEELLRCPLGQVDLFLLNEVEGAALSHETEENKMLTSLQKRFPNAEFLLTLGENGAVFCKGDERFFQPIFKTTVLDTTAAGDTFTGYFLSTYLEGGTAKEALSMASMASSIAVSRNGAATSIPEKEEVLARLQAQTGLQAP